MGGQSVVEPISNRRILHPSDIASTSLRSFRPRFRLISYRAFAVLMEHITLFVVKNKLRASSGPWGLAKSFDSACPVSEFIPKHVLERPQDTRMWMRVNGEEKQVSFLLALRPDQTGNRPRSAPIFTRTTLVSRFGPRLTER